MSEVKRHQIDLSNVRQWRSIRMDRRMKLLDKYEWDLKTLELFAKNSLEIAIYSAVLEDEKSAFDGFRESLNAHVGELKLLAFDRMVSVIVNKRVEYTFEPIFNQKGIRVSLWLKTYYLAVILRDRDALDFLKTIPLAKINYTSVDEVQMLSRNYIQFCYSTLLGEVDTKILEECYKITSDGQIINSYKITPENIPYLSLFIMNNELLSLIRLYENDLDGFNTTMTCALKDHRNFWSQKRIIRAGGEMVCTDYNGFVSLPLLATAVVAYDKKINLDDESDYIPDFLIVGE